MSTINKEAGDAKTGTVLNTETLSAEIDLGAVYEDVKLMVNPTEAAKMGAAAVNSLQAKQGTVWDAIFRPDGSGSLQSFSKPASGGVSVTYSKANSRYIRLSSSIAATADFTFTVQGVGKIEFVPSLQRATLP